MRTPLPRVSRVRETTSGGSNLTSGFHDQEPAIDLDNLALIAWRNEGARPGREAQIRREMELQLRATGLALPRRSRRAGPRCPQSDSP